MSATTAFPFMMKPQIHFACPHCRRETAAALENAGRTGTCRVCRGKVKIPAPPAPSIEAPPAVAATDGTNGGDPSSHDTRVIKNVLLMILGGLAGWIGVSILAVDLGLQIDLWTGAIIGLLCGWLVRWIATNAE